MQVIVKKGPGPFWIEPLEFAQIIADNYGAEDWVFLYSGLHDVVENSRSYVALFPQKKIVGNDFAAAKKIIEGSDKKWLGYFSYELGSQFEAMVKTKKSAIDLPEIYLVNFAVVFEFDHDAKKLTVSFEDEKKLEKALRWTPSDKGMTDAKPSLFVTPSYDGVQKIKSNFTDKTYLSAIRSIQKMIARGDFYQTNLTRKFFGKFSKKQTPQTAFQLFADLTKISPANYSAFLQLDKNFIISSSPELFLKIENGKILSRPIKGTAPRGSSAKEDKKNKENLKNSPKERAENLMIVDLVRNDLARICKAGSVEVKKLFEITSYKTIHHMSSEIHGELNEKLSNLDAVRACFPAGSMTGAPKIKAMEVAAKKEKINRGIYSGCIGIFEGKKSANLSVVIRTLVVKEHEFEFQAGGAITFDSSPEAELEEVFSKSKALVKILRK